MAEYRFAITITDAMEEDDITEAFRLLRAEISAARKTELDEANARRLARGTRTGTITLSALKRAGTWSARDLFRKRLITESTRPSHGEVRGIGGAVLSERGG